jgi:hypothetical protein
VKHAVITVRNETRSSSRRTSITGFFCESFLSQHRSCPSLSPCIALSCDSASPSEHRTCVGINKTRTGPRNFVKMSVVPNVYHKTSCNALLKNKNLEMRCFGQEGAIVVEQLQLSGHFDTRIVISAKIIEDLISGRDNLTFLVRHVSVIRTFALFYDRRGNFSTVRVYVICLRVRF